MTTDEWLAYGEDEYDEAYEERRDAFLESIGDRSNDDPSPAIGSEVLTSEEIATLYGLAPAPEGQRYAVVDGSPLLLSEEDYQTLEIITRIARVELPESAPDIAPDRTLGPDQIARLYKLPDPGADVTYAVVNGEVVALGTEAYEMLQLLRVARAAT